MMKKIIMALLILVINQVAVAQSRKQSIEIEGNADFLQNGDTVKLVVYKYGLINQVTYFHYPMTSVVKGGWFKFKWMTTAKLQYITLNFTQKRNIYFHDYVVRPGDRINLNMKNNQLTISGRKCKIFRIQNVLRNVEAKFLRKQLIPEFNAQNLEKVFSIWDDIATAQADTLFKYKKQMSASNYVFLNNEINAIFNWTKYYDLNYYGMQFIDSLNNPIAGAFQKYKFVHPDKVIKSDRYLSFSNNYLEYLIEKYKVDSCLLKNKKYDVSSCISHFINCYTGPLREQLITAVLSDTRSYPNSLEKEIKASLTFVSNRDYRKFLKSVLATRIDGANSSNLSLTDINGKKIHLANFKNKVIVLDFWYTGCGNCRELAPVMAKIESQFKNRPVQFIGVSIDKSKDQFVKSVEEGKYVSPDIVNVYTNGNGDQDKSLQDFQVKAYPTLIIINLQGKIVNVPSDPRDDDGKSFVALLNDCI